jgi:hypothetical protein
MPGRTCQAKCEKLSFCYINRHKEPYIIVLCYTEVWKSANRSKVPAEYTQLEVKFSSFEITRIFEFHL